MENEQVEEKVTKKGTKKATKKTTKKVVKKKGVKVYLGKHPLTGEKLLKEI